MSKFLIAFIISLTLFLIAKKAQPIANRSGQTLENDPAVDSILSAPDIPLKVATFNIQTGKNLQGKRNIERAAAVIHDQHLVGLQEVYAPGWLNKLGIGRSQLRSLTIDTSFGHLFSATRRRWFREQRGNAILSRLPVAEWHIQGLPDYSSKSFRNMTTIKTSWQGETLHFINTHLHTGKGRDEQLQVVLNEFAKYPRAILVGDFNSRSDMTLLSNTLNEPSVTDAIHAAELDHNNPDRIDWILTKGFKVADGRMLEKGISDHPYYEVSLVLEETPAD